MNEKEIIIDDGRPVGYITTAEFAERFGVQQVTVRQWIRRGKLETIQIGRQHFIPSGTAKPIRKNRETKNG